MDIRLLAPLATTMGILVSILLWHLNQRKKILSYSILRRHLVLNLSGSARDELDIRFAGESIADAYLIVIRIFNSGHLPITTQDYQTPISVALNPGASILAASVIDTTPTDLEERIKNSNENQTLIQKVTGERILLTPILLNEGDSLTLQMLARNTIGNLTIRGHIQGIKRIDPWHESRLLPLLLTQLGAFIMAFAMLGVQPSELVRMEIEHILPWVLMFVLGFVILNAGMYWPRNGEFGEFQVPN